MISISTHHTLSTIVTTYSTKFQTYSRMFQSIVMLYFVKYSCRETFQILVSFSWYLASFTSHTKRKLPKDFRYTLLNDYFNTISLYSLFLCRFLSPLLYNSNLYLIKKFRFYLVYQKHNCSFLKSFILKAHSEDFVTEKRLCFLTR